MPKTSSSHQIQTILTLELGQVGTTVEIPARISWTYHPGDSRPPRPTDIDPPEPELIEDVRLEVCPGNQGHWRPVKDPALELLLLTRVDEDLCSIAAAERQAQYEDARGV